MTLTSCGLCALACQLLQQPLILGYLLGGVLVGLALPLASSLGASVSPLEIAIWGAATVAFQLLVFRAIDLILHGLPQRIQEGEMSAAILLVGAKLACALILAAALAG